MAYWPQCATTVSPRKLEMIEMETKHGKYQYAKVT